MVRFKKALLVRLSYHGTFLGDASSIPVGLGYIAEALYSNEIDYDVYDMGLSDHNTKGLFKKIEGYEPDLIGITLMTMHYKYHYEAINEIKQRFPTVKIVAGGPHVSTFREKVLEECASIDYGVVLEGEESIVELCRDKNLFEVKGLIHRDFDRIIYNGDPSFIHDLDKIPFPKYRKFELSDYLANSIGIQTTRGCPYACIYCPVMLAIGKKFRARSPENIVDEMLYWYSQGRRDFAIWDDNFTLIEERVFEICNLIEKRGMKDLKISVPNGIRADKASYDLLKRMHEIGFYMLSFGIEAGNDKVLKNLKKGTNVETMEKAVRNACELGYDVYLYFIIGSSGETFADFKESLNFAKKYPVAEARFYTLIPFPKTELYEWVNKNDYFVREPEEYLNTADHFLNEPCFATPEMSRSERKKAFRIGWRLTKHLKVRHKIKTLERFSILKKPLASFLLSDMYKRLYKKNWFRKIIVNPFRKYKTVH